MAKKAVRSFPSLTRVSLLRGATHVYAQIEDVVPQSAVLFLLCLLRRLLPVAYGKLDVVLSREFML